MSSSLAHRPRTPLTRECPQAVCDVTMVTARYHWYCEDLWLGRIHIMAAEASSVAQPPSSVWERTNNSQDVHQVSSQWLVIVTLWALPRL